MFLDILMQKRLHYAFKFKLGTLCSILESLHQNQLPGSSKSCSLKRLQQFLGTWLVQFKGIRWWFCVFLHTICVAGPLPGVHGGQ